MRLILGILLLGAPQALAAEISALEPKVLLENARAQQDLQLATQGYRAVIAADAQGPWGNQALLELGKQEYALGHTEAAIILLSKVLDEQLEGENKGQLYYWRAQSRLVLKGFQVAQEDFEAFLKLFPDHALADSARLAVADCDAVLKNHEAAFKGYQILYQLPASSVAPQAMLQAAALYLRTKQQPAAIKMLLKLAEAYPESLEAGRARELLKDLPAIVPSPAALPLAASVPLETAFTIQVGAYTRHVGALKLFEKLRKKGYAVRLEKRVLEDNVFHILQMGRYPSRAKAQKVADRFSSKEKLPARVVELEVAP